MLTTDPAGSTTDFTYDDAGDVLTHDNRCRHIQCDDNDEYV